MVGDFNAHNPAWDKEGRRSPEAEPLVRLAEDWDLMLRTPFGELTRLGRRNGERDSIIDHAWASRTLGVNYLGVESMVGSDHVPQAVEINDTPVK